MPATSTTITDIEHGVVMAHAGADRIPEAVESARYFGMRSQHYGWPGVTKTLEGDILVSASERIRHVDPFGREVFCRSSDSGKTWTEPEVIFDSNTDDRDAAVCTLPDGTIIFTWFSSSVWASENRVIPQWQKLRENVRDDTLKALSRGWLKRSTDGGRTWEPRVYPTIVGQHAGPSPLADGDLIYCGDFERQRFVATRSSDGGKTWRIVGEIPCELVVDNHEQRRPAFNENHCVELEPGHVLCVLRATNEPRNVHLSESRDGGATWTEPRDLGIYGFPSELTRLSSGAILCVFGDRRDKQAIRGIVSHDQGRTWNTDEPLLIREFEHGADMGYPVAVELDPGHVLCVYYYVPQPPPGETTPALEHTDPAAAGILCTHFRLP